ncbi:MAG: hypothetical protein GY866_29955 [Proteobacteria bacterium]|nr:hypothetical protein [Pseudomonadota bacterium]
MKIQRLILLTVFWGVGLNLFGEQGLKIEYPAEDDPNIIIFSETHPPVSYTKKKDGLLKAGVTTFSPILQVDINGEVIEMNKDTKAEIEFPFILADEVTDFVLTVVTEAGKKSKTFTVNLGEKPKPGKSPFQMVGILGLTNLDNVTSVAEDKKSGTKLVLTVVPHYTIALGTASALNIKGILMRDKYSSSDYAANEISYTQLAVEWSAKKVLSGELIVGTGANDIRTDNGNVIMGSDETALELFLFGGFKQKFLKVISWDFKMEIKSKDSKAEAVSANDDADARETSLKAGLGFKFGGIKGNFRFGQVTNDAKGKYQDSSTTSYGIKANYPQGDFFPGFGYSVRAKTMKEENASLGLAQNDSASTVLIKAGYKLSPKTILGMDVKTKTQTSNVEASEYSTTSITVSVTRIF